MTTVHARVTLERAAPAGYPEVLQFSIPTVYRQAVLENNVAPFVLALLLPAMAMGENIHAHGWVSDELGQRLQEVQTILAGWFPKLSPTSLSVTDGVRRLVHRQEGRVASCFSGDVASFHTLRTLTEQTAPARHLTHVLYPAHSLPFQTRYQQVLAPLGVELVAVGGNLQEFYQPVGLSWGEVGGVATAATIHLFGEYFRTVFIPSMLYSKKLLPWGSHPAIDALLSTDSTRLVHHGLHLCGAEKAVSIADWPLVWHHLHVCRSRGEAKMNCGRCGNCLRTLLALLCTDMLERFQVFPLVADARGVLTFQIPQQGLREIVQNNHEEAHVEGLLALARARNREDIAQVVTTVLNDYWHSLALP